MKKITVFTPTYNRAHLLPRLYASLCIQICKDFEWLVVDDGSNDNTRELLAGYVSENRIEINYIKQPNGGKHRAINRGVANAKGYLFMIVDSDDYFASNLVIEKVIRHIPFLEQNDDFCAVVGNKIFENGKTIGTQCSYDVLDSDFIFYREVHQITGDKAEVIKTVVMREFPFPTFNDEKFMVEGVVWNRMAQKYKAKYLNTPYVICEYQVDGLSASIKNCRQNSPHAFSLYYSEYCAMKRVRFVNKVKRSIAYWATYFKVDHNNRLREKYMIKYFWITKPFGWLLHKMNKL